MHQLLRGFPAATIAACAEFLASRRHDAFERAMGGFIEHHLVRPAPQPLAAMPGSTRLVEELGLDSMTMAEMAFLFEDVFGSPLPHDQLSKVVTLDDLRRLLWSCVSPPPPA